jgi:hypothetical protein
VRTRTTVAVTSVAALLIAGAAELTGGAAAQAATGTIATTTQVTANNPLGNTPGKLVMTGKVRPVTGSAVATGTCTFSVDTTVVGTKPVNTRGNCSLTTHVKLGTHTVKIAYSGSTVLAASSGSTTIDVTR